MKTICLESKIGPTSTRTYLSKLVGIRMIKNVGIQDGNGKEFPTIQKQLSTIRFKFLSQFLHTIFFFHYLQPLNMQTIQKRKKNSQYFVTLITISQKLFITTKTIHNFSNSKLCSKLSSISNVTTHTSTTHLPPCHHHFTGPSYPFPRKSSRCHGYSMHISVCITPLLTPSLHGFLPLFCCHNPPS